MCGIVGLLQHSERAPDLAAVKAAMAALGHRGPDADGLWTDGVCALGHTRLAIIDLSELGRQPLCNEDGTVWITFNGEVYNFQELRRELETRGHQFRSGTDTEAIAHAYEEWGVDCVKRLRGMFAFAIWDQPRRRLFLARDRVGKKPLFYSLQGDWIAFASELQGLLALPGVPREPDPEALDLYLSWGYVPAPRTAFRGVAKLPAAGWLTVDCTPEGLVLDSGVYWRLEYAPKLRLTEAEAAEALRETLTEAVRLRMVADVPLGAFLSGGIDSSIVVGLMAGLSGRPVKTFSIGFAEAEFDELPHARRVAERFGTEHQEFVVRPDAASVLPLLARHYGEPFADDSALPTYYLCRMTRSAVTVALNGDGGDESFGGYERYLANRLAEALRRTPGARAGIELLRRVLPQQARQKGALRKLERFLEAAALPMAERYGRWIGGTVGGFSPAEKASLYSAGFRASLNGASGEAWLAALFAGTEGLDPADAAMSVDVRSYLPYDLLVKVDVAAMASSLEARSPLLDHQVMELAAKLPADLKLRGRTTKYLLRRTFADMLPPENTRRGKMGFGAPVGEWLRGELRELLHDALLSGRSLARGYFEPEALRALVRRHEEWQADHALQLWSLLMLELWHRELVDSRPAAAPGHGTVRNR